MDYAPLLYRLLNYHEHSRPPFGRMIRKVRNDDNSSERCDANYRNITMPEKFSPQRSPSSGYHWDINEPLEIDTAKNLTGIKVIGADRTVRTSHLNKLC